MLNSTGSANMSSELPPLPSYTLHPDDQILPYISNLYLSLLVPFIAYWALSFVFEFIDYYDLFPQYRIHTPAEIQNRNVVTRYEVARDVLLQQVLQAGMGAILALTEKEDLYGKADYDVAVWAQRLRIAQRALPQLLSFLGLNAAAISKNVSGSHPMVAALLAGGDYSLISQFDPVSGSTVPAFATWEMTVAKAIYWVIIPAIQFGLAVFIQDTWQYFLHRAMHMNKYLYTTFHSRHHRLYVPYAFGALYNHPFEGFLLDTLGASIAFKATGMTVRQGMLFFGGSTIKTVDDHCGYALPWDPLQHITGNNAEYHDIHHQSWGIKTNFSQPFFTVWDRWLDTIWKGDTEVRYERSRKSAEAKMVAEKSQ